MRIEKVFEIMKNFDYVVGIDEVGRGCLAGPMFVCAVVMSPYIFIEGVKDSKLLSKKKRERLLPSIVKNVKHIGIGIVSNKEIDSFGMSVAIRLGIIRALSKLKYLPKLIITDYVNIKSKNFEIFLKNSNLKDKHKYIDIYSKIRKYDDDLILDEDGYFYISVKKADLYVHPNSVASVVAKVLRDRYMSHISRKYPMYGFDRNKGYATREHISAIKSFGFSEVHRLSFRLGSL